MLENTWYSVIAPESCSSILWRSWDHKEEAAEVLKLTSEHMSEFGLVDGIVKEPLGGAHANPEEMARILRRHIKATLEELEVKSPEARIEERIAKFSKMGQYAINEKLVSTRS
jgi:acetyl-CoA carboxylase carboxyl transferase subunit alpha